MTHLSYQFGDFVCDPAKRELNLRGEPVTLPLKVFECIVYLIEHRDRAVGRDEMLAAVWGRVDLADNALAQTILLARRALGDAGVIATVRGFGYRWTAPVRETSAIETAQPPAAAAPAAATSDTPQKRRTIFIALSIALAAAVLLAGGYWLTRRASGPPPQQPGFGHAVVLPVQVEDGPRTGWIRLGVMDLIASQLRSLGLPVMPSDTMLALTGNVERPGGGFDPDAVAAATGAALVLEAQAIPDGDHWRVELRTRHGQEPPVAVQGRARDVLDAADLAVGRMGVALGFARPPEALQERALATLLQQIRSARLSNQMDEARRLIDATPPELAAHPEVRFEAASIDQQSNAPAAAEREFLRLLDEIPAQPQTASLRGRLLHALSAVAFRRGDLAEAERLVSEAIPLLRSFDAASQLGRALSGRAMLRFMRGDEAAARADFELARLALESAGDRLGLARMQNNLGVQELQHERYADAAMILTQAADAFRSLHDVESELRTRAAVLHARLMLLQYPEALAERPRLTDLIAQATDLDVRLHARTLLAELLLAVGETGAAERAIAEIRNGIGDRESTLKSMLESLRLLREGRAADALRQADAVAEHCAANPACQMLPMFWRIGIQTRVATHAPAADASAATPPGNAIAARLIAAELAASVPENSENRQAAREAFESALALADASAVPLYQRDSAIRYAEHLLASGDMARAQAVAQRVRPWAERDYESLWLLLRVGLSTDAQADAARLRILAGERPTPFAAPAEPE